MSQESSRPTTAGREVIVVRGKLTDWSSTPGLAGLERAFEFLARRDLDALPLGRTTLDGDDVYVLVAEAETRPAEKVPFEAHRRYVDVQLVVRGQEAIGTAPVSALVTSAPYDPVRDVEFFAPPAESATLALHAGEFAVFAPGDAHQPGLHLDGRHLTRKAVVKVSVAYRETQAARPRSASSEPRGRT